MRTLLKVLLILAIIAVLIAVPAVIAYGIYLLLVKLGAAKWVAAAIAIALWVIMGIGANRAK